MSNLDFVNDDQPIKKDIESLGYLDLLVQYPDNKGNPVFRLLEKTLAV